MTILNTVRTMNIYLDYHVDLDDLKHNTVRLRNRLDNGSRDYSFTFRLTKLFNINKKEFKQIVMMVCEYILGYEKDGWYTRDDVCDLYDKSGAEIYSTIKSLFDAEMKATEDKMGNVKFQHIIKLEG